MRSMWNRRGTLIVMKRLKITRNEFTLALACILLVIAAIVIAYKLGEAKGDADFWRYQFTNSVFVPK